MTAGRPRSCAGGLPFCRSACVGAGQGRKKTRNAPGKHGQKTRKSGQTEQRRAGFRQMVSKSDAATRCCGKGNFARRIFVGKGSIFGESAQKKASKIEIFHKKIYKTPLTKPVRHGILWTVQVVTTGGSHDYEEQTVKIRALFSRGRKKALERRGGSFLSSFFHIRKPLGVLPTGF